jgi:biopolymer transport protein ExbD
MEANHVRGGRIAVINVTPMVDVMIVLLIIFMVSTPFIQAGRVRHPPLSETARATKEAALNVAIAADAMTYLNDVPVPRSEDLRGLLRVALESAPEALVHVKAEGALPYRTVARVLDDCRAAGAARVALVVRPRTSEGLFAQAPSTTRNP